MRVVFGHQSVGQNLLDGIRELAAAGLPAANVTSPEELGAAVGDVAIGAFRVGRNGNPQSKLRHFAAVAQSPAGLRADAVLFKFCYVDFHQGTDVIALFDDYRFTMDTVRRQRPERLVGQVTVPLRTLSSGAIARIRHQFDRHHPQLHHNVVRDRFNELLRREYGGSRSLFDLGAIESGDQNGWPRQVLGPNGPVSALRPEYSADGGHLNVHGRRVSAQGFLAYLGRL
jgi:hypothetical protein